MGKSVIIRLSRFQEHKMQIQCIMDSAYQCCCSYRNMSYSKLMGALHKSGIEMNRKVLADLAMNHPEAFTAILLKAKNS